MASKTDIRIAAASNMMDDLWNIIARLYQPVDDVGEEVVVPQSVLDINLLVVDGESPIKDASLLK